MNKIFLPLTIDEKIKACYLAYIREKDETKKMFYLYYLREYIKEKNGEQNEQQKSK